MPISQRGACLATKITDSIAGGKVTAALFSTYTFNQEFFETGPLDIISDEGRRRGLFPVTVIIDPRQYHGSKYGYDIARPDSGRLWHAKLVVLMVRNHDQSKSWTVFAIGSGNLTRAGWETNQELFHVGTWPGWILPEPIQRWLEEPWLKNSEFGIWCRENGIRTMQQMNRARIHSSLEIPIWKQLAWTKTKQRWREAYVLAPFSDLADDEESGAGSSAFFRTLAACAQSNHVLLHVYLRGTDEVENTAIGEKSVFEKLSKKVKLRIHIVRPKNGRLLHAKLFAFRVGGNWSLLIGSPNATRPAMIGENGNIELVWEFRKLGKSFPFNLLPPAPPVPLRKIQFQTPKFKYERRWEALESASYTPKSRRMNLIWKPKFGFHNTKLLLGGRPLDPDHVDLRSTEDRFIESRPFIRTSLKYRPGFVPITMPAGQADLPLPDWGDENLSPEQWLGLLGDPLWKPEGVRHGGRKGGHGQSHEPQSKGLFHWRTQVLGLSKKLQSLRDSISETTTSQELDRLMHVLEGVWKSHDASLKGLPAIDVAWRKWVRAAIWQVLRDECDGRLKNHQDLCALRARWKSKISKVLKEFPIA